MIKLNELLLHIFTMKEKSTRSNSFVRTIMKQRSSKIKQKLEGDFFSQLDMVLGHVILDEKTLKYLRFSDAKGI